MGGAKIVNVIQDNFSKKIMEMNSLYNLSDEQIRNYLLIWKNDGSSLAILIILKRGSLGDIYFL